jgi:hypothetical protein
VGQALSPANLLFHRSLMVRGSIAVVSPLAARH